MDWSPDSAKSIPESSFTVSAITHSLSFCRTLYWSLQKLEREHRNALALESLPRNVANSNITNCGSSVCPSTGSFKQVQLAACPRAGRADSCHDVSSCFDPAILAAGSPPNCFTSKTYLLTSLEALSKLLTSKANLTLSSHPPLTSSINSMNRLESRCVTVVWGFLGGFLVWFFFCDRLSSAPCQLGLETWKSWHLGGCYQAGFVQFIWQATVTINPQSRQLIWRR